MEESKDIGSGVGQSLQSEGRLLTTSAVEAMNTKIGHGYYSSGKVRVNRKQSIARRIIYTLKQKFELPISIITYSSTLALKTVASVVGLFLLSVLCYFVIYSYYVPQYSMTRPVLFYRKTLTKVREGLDGKETAIVRTIASELSVSDTEFFMTPGLNYRITLHLDMPESAVNAYVGCFNLKSTLRDGTGRVLTEKERLIQLTYKSPLVRVIESWLYLPLYLLGFSEERYQTSAVLFRNYMEGYGDRQTSILELTIDNPEIQIYEASISVQTLYKGLRYYMYHWRMTSATLIVVLVFLCSSAAYILNLLIWHFGLWCTLYSWLPLGKVPARTQSDYRYMNGPEDNYHSADW